MLGALKELTSVYEELSTFVKKLIDIISKSRIDTRFERASGLKRPYIKS